MRMAYSLRSRSPHGERGLKLLLVCHRRKKARSLPTRGAWIEILSWLIFLFGVMSLPTRGAWIEISISAEPRPVVRVAPHTGSVD